MMKSVLIREWAVTASAWVSPGPASAASASAADGPGAVSRYRLRRNSASGPPRTAPITRPAVAEAMVSSMAPWRFMVSPNRPA